MSETTKVYNLVKPDPTENYDIAVPNKNMDIIDQGLADRCRTSSSKPTEPGKEGDRCADLTNKREYVYHNGSWTRSSCIKLVEQLPATAEEGDIFFVYGSDVKKKR